MDYEMPKDSVVVGDYSIELESPSSIIKNDPSMKQNRTGGWRFANLLLLNQGLATLAFFGVGVNLVLFLTRVIELDTADAANLVSRWTGLVYLCSLAGAFLSDSYFGRYFICGISQLILVLGCGLLSIASWLFLIKPAGCGGAGALALECDPPSTLGRRLFYLSILMVAFGYGGHQPTLATFGSDQFDESNPKEKESKTAFFSYFYLALNLGSLFSNTVLVYFEDTGKWTIGFLVSLGSATIALASFLVGSRGYRYVKPSGNPIPRVFQVFYATIMKWKLAPAEADKLYELQGSKSAIKGSRKILHSNEFSLFDKAATLTDDEVFGPKNPWLVCTVTQVEEVKCIFKMIPIWLCTIIYSVIFTQMASLFVQQGDAMNTRLSANFRIPAATMSTFDILSVLLTTAFYRHALLPLGIKPSALQRMGIGLIIGLLAMVAAGITELERLKHADSSSSSSLSILWQAPQYILVGASEVFMYVGQLEFFNGQAPDGLKSLGSSLCMASISFGNFVSSLLVNAIMATTKSPGWIPDDINDGHIDRFFFLIAGLTVVDLVVYVFCARWYKGIVYVENEEGSSSTTNKVVPIEEIV